MYKLILVIMVTGICSQELKWWEAGVIYQIYPRSFKDSNGDGVGDLKGIEEKVDYLKSLGVVGVWLSPIYKSPMADFGYDISDFRTVDPIFGSNDDLKSLHDKLSEKGIKLMMDFVPNHSSDEHEWFQKSIDRIDPYTDYYVWKDPKSWIDGKPVPPNNWLSMFGGSSWKFNEKRQQFYYHKFLPKQPDLNYRNPELCKEMTDIIGYWMEFGIDGFRADAVSTLVEHPEFLDEPLLPGKVDKKSSVNSYNDYDHYLYTTDRPETFDIMELFAKTMREYDKPDKQRYLVTESSYDDVKLAMKYYGNETVRRANMPFNFFLISKLGLNSTAKDFNDVINLWMDEMPNNLVANWVTGNHDVHRLATRYGRDTVDAMNMISCGMPGTVFIFNGDELGMEDTFIRWDQTVDPPGRFGGPETYTEFSRDPERTPFQWDSSTSSGFSTNPITWLPVNPNYWWLNWEVQKDAKRSNLKVYQRLVQLKSTKTMQFGSYETHVLSDWILAISRKLEGHESYYIVVNLGSQEEVISLQMHMKDVPLQLIVHTASLNSEHEIGDILSTSAHGFKMRPKSALLLTDKMSSDVQQEHNTISIIKIPPVLYEFFAKMIK